MSLPRLKLDVGPRDESEVLVFAQESFRVELQTAVNGAMKKRGWTDADLASQSGLQQDRIDAFFSFTASVDVREIGRLLHAVGLCATIDASDVVRERDALRSKLARVEQAMRDLF